MEQTNKGLLKSSFNTGRKANFKRWEGFRQIVINEGGPGSGPSASSSGQKPKVLAHWDYKGPQYTAGVKVPKPSSPNYRQVWKGEAKEHAIVMGPAHISTYPLAKGGALLTYPPQTKESGTPITIGGTLSPSYPHSPTEADSGSSFPGVMRSNDKKF